jgi:hypothetical protein
MDKVFGFLIVLGIGLAACTDSQQYAVADRVAVVRGFFADCRGLLVSREATGYKFVGECLVDGEIIGPVQGLVAGNEIEPLEE